MYFIAFFKDLKKNLIVPKQWIKDIKLHKEKFYNNSLNRSQTFTCFYTDNPNAFDDDGLPIGNFVPNFDAKIHVGTQIDGDSLFRIQLVTYKASRDGAVEYTKSHRNMAPGLYNENRLREKPIPPEQDENNLVYSDPSDDERSFEEIIVPNNNENPNITLNDPLGLSPNNSNVGITGESSNQNASCSPAPNAPDVRTEVNITAESNDQNDSFSSVPNATVVPTVSIAIANGVVSITEMVKSCSANPTVLATVTGDQSAEIGTQQNFENTAANNNQLSTQSVSDGATFQIDTVETVAADVTQENIDNGTNTETEGNQSTNAPTDEIDVKPNIDIIPMYEVHRSNQNAILDQLEDRIVEIVDDEIISITTTSKGFGKPLNTTTEGLVKQEADEISGDMAFLNTKSGRVYKIGTRFMEIPHMVFARFSAWNKPPFKHDAAFDKRFVFALILALTEEEKLAKNEIPQEVMEFVKALLEIRCGWHAERVMALPEYAREVCASKRPEA